MSKSVRFIYDMIFVKITGLKVPKVYMIKYVRAFIFFLVLKDLSMCVMLISRHFFSFIFETILIEIFLRLDIYRTEIKNQAMKVSPVL